MGFEHYVLFWLVLVMPLVISGLVFSADGRRRRETIINEIAQQQPESVTVHIGDYRAAVTVDPMELIDVDVDPCRDSLIARMRAQLDAQITEAFAIPSRQSFVGQAAIGQGATDRSLALLREWLSPSQLDQYKRTGGFEVVGSQGGHYRVTGGLTEELDGDGKFACGWCFGPQGYLPIGDMMLARKIALETDEAGTRAIANRQDIRFGLYGEIINAGWLTVNEVRARGALSPVRQNGS